MISLYGYLESLNKIVKPSLSAALAWPYACILAVHMMKSND